MNFIYLRKKNIYKFFLKILLIVFFCILKRNSFINTIYEINENYLQMQNEINIKFNNKLKKKIRIGFYTYSLKDGGLQRLTSLILKYLSNITIYDIYLFTKNEKESNEYEIPNNISRTFIKSPKLINLINQTIINKLDILVYNFCNPEEIKILNKLKFVKIIFYIHQSFFYWIYLNYNQFKKLYESYFESKYVISIVPFDNDYLFKNWGIRSILMDNFISYEYNSIVPSDLSAKCILMIGRGEDKLKRFNLGIKALKYIIQEIPDSYMIIISNINSNSSLTKLVKNLNLKKNIKFVGYLSTPEVYFKNASLHIIPSISESFSMVLCETKIYGIPNILVGLDYLSTSLGGTIIIYDDQPLSIAKNSIKILKNDKYRKKLGKQARNSMKKFKNELILKKWNKLILSIYNGDNYYIKLRENEKKISINAAKNIMNNQIKLLKIRNKIFANITAQNLINFTYLKDLKF